ncbi:nucleotide exchange factor GrpE [Nesterenkonia sphaerica]|uniref:Protein GrpE n=1 Tax=Nesterenkonia sphaerica TaxID=1804988 RepID=A0A5R9AMA9_9MICC|nr:nucleotide exchange factor GrpE [Nesterenkonia sphaerica]TLP78996.1 nucleotide exchange factor GrpE [Nesterenkonia sphaerica]
MAKDKYNSEASEPEEPFRFTDKRRFDPETGEPRRSAEGEATVEDREAAAADPSADPLAEAERILADAPDGAFEEAPHAHEEPAGEDSDHEPQLEEHAEVLEDPELREVSWDEAIGGGETEPEERIQAAEQALEDSGYDREAELEDDLRRVQAEYVNYRRRVERDRSLEKERVKGQLISELMPVLDDIAAARQAGDLEDGPLAGIAGRLEQILTQQGLTPVGEVGEQFDPNEHEAIMQQPHPEIEADQIAIVVRTGYRFNDRLLRAAQVIVSAGPE